MAKKVEILMETHSIAYPTTSISQKHFRSTSNSTMVSILMSQLWLSSLMKPIRWSMLFILSPKKKSKQSVDHILIRNSKKQNIAICRYKLEMSQIQEYTWWSSTLTQLWNSWMALLIQHTRGCWKINQEYFIIRW